MPSAHYQLEAAEFLQECFPQPATEFRPFRNTQLCGERRPSTEYARYKDIVSG